MKHYPIEPPLLVQIPAGFYPIGSPPQDEHGLDDERPYHKVELAPFQIGQYPVTVAEYRRFVEAGGYGKARYWDTDDARAWLEGEDPAGGPYGRILRLRQTLLDSRRPLEDWAQEHNWKPETLQNWQKWTVMSEAEVRQDLHSIIPAHPRTNPAWWDDAAHTVSNHPVVGVTWYEAQSYCAWLTEATGRPFRLPTEVEWEAAMRGTEGRRYPWGQHFDPTRANTAETQMMETTPVDAYPRGVSLFGVWDGAGNVWEWTSSLYKPYPYQADDGREDATSAEKRVLRGGSWYSFKEQCRCTIRDATIPDLYSYYVGFRIATDTRGEIDA
jgi:formylglycine-generating enzyme required for sulfatase activity